MPAAYGQAAGRTTVRGPFGRDGSEAARSRSHGGVPGIPVRGRQGAPGGAGRPVVAPISLR